MASVGARIVRGHELRVTRAPSATIAAAVLDALADAGLDERRVDGGPAADVIVIAVPPGRGNGALNVAQRAIELDLAGDGAELEARLYAPHASGDKRRDA
jgi:hypothetical protein